MSSQSVLCHNASMLQHLQVTHMVLASLSHLAVSMAETCISCSILDNILLTANMGLLPAMPDHAGWSSLAQRRAEPSASPRLLRHLTKYSFIF